MIEMSNEEKSFQKTNINWLACIYDDYHLTPLIKWEFLRVEILQFSIKKEEK